MERRIDYERELNGEQRDAVLNGDGISLVLAGAGSGKTRTITYRVAHLIEQGADPREMLLLTFTNRAAREMRERAERLLGASVEGLWAGTFHSIANRLLRSYADRLGYDRSFTILDSDDSKSLMKSVLKEMNIDTDVRRFPSPAVCLSIISYSRNVCGTVAGTLEASHPHLLDLESDLIEAAARYDERKRRSNAMDFDDLLIRLLELLDNPDFGPHIASRFRHVLVDEFQDTNALQARMVRRFASGHGNAFIVGDDAQSIYGFRGADVQNILNLPFEYENVKTFKLVTNYRSTPQILDIANDSLRHNTDQFKKDLIGLREKGEKPSLISCASAREEARLISDRISDLRNRGTELSDIAVLFRAASHSQQLEFELIKRDLPYEYRGGIKLFERAHVKDVLAHLRVFHNVKDEPAWVRLLSMRPGIGESGAVRMAGTLTAFSDIVGALAADASMFRGRASSGWAALRAVLNLVSSKAPNPAEMIRAVAGSDYQAYLEGEYPNWEDRLDDIEQFALFAESYADLESFLGEVLLYDDALALGKRGERSDRPRVILSTIHQAKGLEWDAVFMMHLADGFFPNKRAMAEDGGIEEERRLFYVAVTRARKQLVLSYPLTIGLDMMSLQRPSMFLDELDPRLLNREEFTGLRFGIRPPASASGDWDADDGGFEEDVIELDRYGEQKKSSFIKSKGSSSGSLGTVWKKKR